MIVILFTFYEFQTATGSFNLYQDRHKGAWDYGESKYNIKKKSEKNDKEKKRKKKEKRMKRWKDEAAAVKKVRIVQSRFSLIQYLLTLCNL